MKTGFLGMLLIVVTLLGWGGLAEGRGKSEKRDGARDLTRQYVRIRMSDGRWMMIPQKVLVPKGEGCGGGEAVTVGDYFGGSGDETAPAPPVTSRGKGDEGSCSCGCQEITFSPAEAGGDAYTTTSCICGAGCTGDCGGEC